MADKLVEQMECGDVVHDFYLHDLDEDMGVYCIHNVIDDEESSCVAACFSLNTLYRMFEIEGVRPAQDVCEYHFTKVPLVMGVCRGECEIGPVIEFVLT